MKPGQTIASDSTNAAASRARASSAGARAKTVGSPSAVAPTAHECAPRLEASAPVPARCAFGDRRRGGVATPPSWAGGALRLPRAVVRARRRPARLPPRDRRRGLASVQGAAGLPAPAAPMAGRRRRESGAGDRADGPSTPLAVRAAVRRGSRRPHPGRCRPGRARSRDRREAVRNPTSSRPRSSTPLSTRGPVRSRFPQSTTSIAAAPRLRGTAPCDRRPKGARRTHA